MHVYIYEYIYNFSKISYRKPQRENIVQLRVENEQRTEKLRECRAKGIAARENRRIICTTRRKGKFEHFTKGHDHVKMDNMNKRATIGCACLTVVQSFNPFSRYPHRDHFEDLSTFSYSFRRLGAHLECSRYYTLLVFCGWQNELSLA